MPLSIHEVKELPESLCYTTGRGMSVSNSVESFLKENADKAWTPKEITEQLNMHLPSTTRYQFKQAKVADSCKFLANNKKNLFHKKGRFYWYEEVKP